MGGGENLVEVEREEILQNGNESNCTTNPYFSSLGLLESVLNVIHCAAVDGRKKVLQRYLQLTIFIEC